MTQSSGEVLPDAELATFIGCSRRSLKVHVFGARAALHNFVFEDGINRQRGCGYHMNLREIESLIRLCDGGKRDRRSTQ